MDVHLAIWLYRDDVRCPVCKGKFKPVDLDGFEYPGVLGKGLQVLWRAPLWRDHGRASSVRHLNSCLLDDNWLRAFYQLRGLDSARAEIAIARRYERSTASVNRLKRAARRKATALQFSERAVSKLF
jgi:hypothetical protein